MAGRRAMSTQGKPFAAGAAFALLFVWLAGPAAASSNTPVGRDDAEESANEFDTFSPGHSRAPRVEALLRKVFKEPAARLDEINDSFNTKRPAMTTRVPGISDGQLARYKRHMYRKDI